MSKNFDTALELALKHEFSWLDHFENPYADYEFSSHFENSIKEIIPKAEFTYISVGKRRVRKALLAAVVALLAIAITGCAVAVYYIVEWYEEQNDKQGTLDVTFELNDKQESNQTNISFPTTPIGYTISEQYNDDFSCIIIYSDSLNNQIIYSFKEISINGEKGYSSFKDGINALYWADNTRFYQLQGTCNLDILLTMAASMVE